VGVKVARVVAVVGPTCTGKSELALWLAPEIGGEIVNADSMQVYRHFDIGTAKPDASVRAAVPHHVIDVAEPGEEFNAARFQKMADDAIREVWSRGDVPIVVGGTGLYLRVLFHGLFEVPNDPDLRRRLRLSYLEDPAGLYGELGRVDPEYARSISPRDGLRIVRALEVYRLSGVRMSGWQVRHGFREERYASLRLGLLRERGELYRRIDRRVDLMLERGWVGEVEDLLRRYPPGARPFQGIGYREIVLYLAGKITYHEMVRKVKTATRHYAKRQFTWFSKETGIEWSRYPEDREAMYERIGGFLD
jgi:tRNA dimethylallyltransferase